MPPYLDIILRAVVTFTVLFLYTRIMGKQQLSQLTFFDYVVGITIGSIAGEIAVDPRTSLGLGLLSLTVWTAFALLVGWLNLKNKTVRDILDGVPLVVIRKGKIQEQSMAKARYNLDELLMQLRKKDVFDISDVETAILEPDGSLSVLQISDISPVTPRQMGLQVPQAKDAIEVISDGQILYSRLKKAGYSLDWLYTQMENQGVQKVEDVVLGQIGKDGSIYFDLGDDSQQLQKPQTKKLLAANLEKLQSDLETFSLETENKRAQNLYTREAQRIEGLLGELRPFL